MAADELRYLVQPRARAEAVLARFRDGFDTRAPRELRTRRLYLDTFDWRLCRSGRRLVNPRPYESPFWGASGPPARMAACPFVTS